MDEEPSSTERNRNLWAPWRMEYIDALGGEQKECFLCRNRDQKDDEKNLVLWRGRRTMVVMNLFPYTGGHCMVAPMEHVGGLDDLDAETMVEMMRMLRDIQRVLGQAQRAEGFNIGTNVGRCAGAGLPGHLHIHVVPRWSGDTNFMAVLGKVRVIPQGLQDTYRLLRKTAQEMHLPKLE